MLTNKATPEKVEIPHEDGEWMEFKPLSWKELNLAAQRRTIAAVQVAGEIPASVYESMRDVDRPQTDTDPTEQYDVATVLEKSIVRWSYEAEVTPENIGALDEPTSAWAHREAIARSVRSEPEGEGSASRSNGTTSATQAGPSS